MSALFKVVKHSFFIPMRYLSLFSNHWQLGGQNWQDAISTKKDFLNMFYWGKYCYHGNTAGNKPALINGIDIFSGNLVIRFFLSFASRKRRTLNTGLAKI